MRNRVNHRITIPLKPYLLKYLIGEKEKYLRYDKTKDMFLFSKRSKFIKTLIDADKLFNNIFSKIHYEQEQNKKYKVKIEFEISDYYYYTIGSFLKPGAIKEINDYLEDKLLREMCLEIIEARQRNEKNIKKVILQFCNKYEISDDDIPIENIYIKITRKYPEALKDARISKINTRIKYFKRGSPLKKPYIKDKKK